MLLQKGSPAGGRPASSFDFMMDTDDSKFAFRLGYIKCKNCERANCVSVDMQDLDELYQVIKIRRPKSFEKKISIKEKMIKKLLGSQYVVQNKKLQYRGGEFFHS